MLVCHVVALLLCLFRSTHPSTLRAVWKPHFVLSKAKCPQAYRLRTSEPNKLPLLTNHSASGIPLEQWTKGPIVEVSGISTVTLKPWRVWLRNAPFKSLLWHHSTLPTPTRDSQSLLTWP